ncbi:MAG: peptidylprolyl isomerase [Deltaproteobacteria bacterium]|nr:peptidylprolyl isomerase [Deltaproteobacteria bacterium]
MAISEGSKVSIEYTLKLDDDSVVDTNVGGEPLVYVQGSNHIIPGLEKELEGLNVGDEKNVKVSPEEGYGPLNDSAFVEVTKEEIPEEARVEGAQLQAENPQGEMVYPIVKELKDETVILDFNHPLAGKELNFHVKILHIESQSSIIV